MISPKYKKYPETAAEYAALKVKLHMDFEHDRDGYIKAKTAFIREVTEKGERKQQYEKNQTRNNRYVG
jgi:GrpB-like predicted nucleotidyltransferase (UPF0157 family)